MIAVIRPALSQVCTWRRVLFLFIVLVGIGLRLAYLDIFKQRVEYSALFQSYAYSWVKNGALGTIITPPADYSKLSQLEPHRREIVERDVSELVKVYPDYGKYWIPFLTYMPGAALMLAGYYSLFGVKSMLYYEVFQAVLFCLLSSWFLFRSIQLAVPRSRIAPWLGLALYQIHPIPMISNVVVDHNNHFTPLILALVYLCLRTIRGVGRELPSIFGIGLVAGLMMYFRSDFIPAPFFFMIAFLIVTRNFKKFIAYSAAIYATMFAVILPYCIYNYQHAGFFSPLQREAGVVMALMLNRCEPNNRWGFSSLPPYAGTQAEYDQFEKGQPDPVFDSNPMTRSLLRVKDGTVFPRLGGLVVPDEMTPWGDARIGRYVMTKIRAMLREEPGFYVHCILGYQLRQVFEVTTGSAMTGLGEEAYWTQQHPRLFPAFYKYWSLYYYKLNTYYLYLAMAGLLVLLVRQSRAGLALMAVMLSMQLPRLPFVINHEYLFSIATIYMIYVSVLFEAIWVTCRRYLTHQAVPSALPNGTGIGVK